MYIYPHIHVYYSSRCSAIEPPWASAAGPGGKGGIGWVGIQVGKKKRKDRRQIPNRLYKAPGKADHAKLQQTIERPNRLYKARNIIQNLKI